jgi:hypothetical protein
MLAAIALGAATGPLLLRRVRNPAAQSLCSTPTSYAAVDAVLPAARTPAVAIGALACYGIGTSTGAITLTACSNPKPPTRCADESSQPSTCSGSSGGSSPSSSEACPPTPLASKAVYYSGAILLAAGAAAGSTGLHLHRTGPT